MINRIAFDRIWKAVDFVWAEGAKDGRNMAFAIADEAGGLILAIRMEGTAARTLRHAMLKSYTSAVMQRDTITFRDEDRERGKELPDWGDTGLTHLVGGMVLKKDDEWFGGVGVGGHVTERDDEIARAVVPILLGD
jgi:uncharacterized protein GlcG (DUF336 family)